MEVRVERAIDIFLDAINNGTLAKGTCAACAVGNLVAAGLGVTIARIPLDDKIIDYECPKDNTAWSDLFVTSDAGQDIQKESLKDKNVLANISATEFTWQELAAIEFVFERNTKISNRDYCRWSDEAIRADQIRGLEAVVKVMLSFSKDNETSVKKVFTERAEKIKV